ncbi:bifunctional diaminohydroxyphosphoribosylaminopyrimidine deaminase/5-amino-6-(5-phosphoribosylamino)uracil reductase RibD [Chlorobaculum sp. MV4-Y]|uniref:bifunctional diaminohydroxyphosphoribosylaminopyrimidine deaminase/5-amino-6-(5-phosphoribosylamino)uracil reductase RibD n=1 Tax=Chlorobaculum sp. MV4-Y TaxID=2976335 RepID=UPI0021AE3A8C|nr:bifunctional diaminohydroxyphosphoribosylaminopyrimidine deaminase/5-amino-6-(5-phosphoribosylamino)uracil reductase RibD [Chlorobaculum sp. MV4-Y]UWX58756.1 bifunctional diaminohydroxyphosphoribosylaminopyrimidine deaminase/5-amino-6-(5-phosphoribosylamino)uracil reductase RibD [Chlorobaculum sp. MV4-Y]
MVTNPIVAARLEDETYMRRCLELAERGAGSVSPNPMVGSVVVHDGRVIGEGWHRQYGGPHAEVNAIASVEDEALLRESTLYVNLEPCSHYGKTPPCADLIIEKRIPRVVVGCLDPHEKVAGKGITKLRDAGIEVTVGVLEAESERLNEAFMTSHRKGRPFVALKTAQTLDGRIATSLGASKWITGEASRREVHRLRSVYDAVLCGASTVIADDSELTVRLCDGRQPLRVLLDRRLQVPVEARIFNSEAKTLVFALRDEADPALVSQLEARGVEVATVGEAEGSLDLGEVFAELHKRRVLSVMVEGGNRLSAAMVRSGFVDKYYIFIAPKLFGGDGLASFGALDVARPDYAVKLSFSAIQRFGEDLLLEVYPVR